MKIKISEPINFEWDEGNRDKNLKHKVLANETEEIFFNKPLVLLPDKKHSTEKELRYHALGRTNKNRQLLIVFTIKNDKIRIISARDMDNKERSRYAQTKTKKIT